MNPRAGLIVAMLGLPAAGCAADRFLDAVDRGDTSAVTAMLADDPRLAHSVWRGRRGGVVQRPLVKAAFDGHLEIVRALLDHGVDPNVTGANQETALHAAALFAEHTAIVDLLLQRGARPEPLDVAGNTPMHRAAESLDGEQATRLLARGASVSVVNQSGDMPLHLAAASGRIHAAAVLCAAGADPAARDAKQQTPQARSGNQTGERLLTLGAWLDPTTGECARLARMARTTGKPAPAEAVRAAAAAYECLLLQHVKPDPLFPKRRPNQALWCGTLGHAQEEGVGAPKDENRAAVSYRLACENGEVDSCTRLGVMLEEGRGGARDPARASALYEKACAAADLWGCSRLGHMQERGLGVPRDEKAAAALYERACAGNRAWSCGRLARLYDRGIGVPRDAVKAAQLNDQACALGEKDSCSKTAGSRRTGSPR